MNSNLVRTWFLKEFITKLILVSAPYEIKTRKVEKIVLPEYISKKEYVQKSNTGQEKTKLEMPNLPQLPPLPKKEVKPIELPIGVSPYTRIQPIILDPTVSAIECSGAGKPLIVTRGNRIQPTNIAFTEEQIKQILKEIAERTKIPLITGVFKAAYGNIIITAVISEFVGTRFVIQKRFGYYPTY